MNFGQLKVRYSDDKIDHFSILVCCHNIFNKTTLCLLVVSTILFGGGEKHRRYVGFRYVIRVFFMVYLL